MRAGFRTLFISLLLFLWFPLWAEAQHAEIKRDYEKGRLSLDQKILYQLQAGENPQRLPRDYRRADPAKPIKCGTPARMDFHNHRSQLSAGTVARVESMTADPGRHATGSYRSASGRFEVNYTTSGDHAVPDRDANSNGTPDYVEWVAQAADSSYRHEVLTLGYSDPVPDINDPYQVHFKDIDFYGYTEVSNGTTYIVMHNSYEDFPENDDPQGNQRGAIRATMAHELKHAIQYAATGWNGETDQWSEMDATLMEEVVYDEVNDYYSYLRDPESIFSDPEASFYPGSYYHVSWALYFEEKYGSRFWPSVWQIIRSNPDITMVDALSRQLGSDEAFRRDYIESQLWHYAAGPNNSADDFGFEERLNYPHPDLNSGNNFYAEDLSTPQPVPPNSLNNFSAAYYSITPPSEASGHVAVDITSSGPGTGIGILAYFTDGSTDFKTFSSADGKAVASSTSWSWEDISSAGIVLSNADTDSSSQSAVVKVGNSEFNQLTLYQNYPNPFRRETTIRFTLEEPAQVTLKIYDTIGRRVRTLYDQKLEEGLYVKTLDGTNLASGIYIYQLTTGRQTVARKMTLIK
ncbi:Por secretion system C-terminal sorting domain-containing protein [Fodinibius roseus]|uniref:Por secretion system C-terminal sorting domain-containing protein n=1 Tax=Fodinibius roseus TaxID=1194090 RepID=A0A1M4ZG53_9BACT|nr:T9SS type A sorting domain-containing protein [Fodinibius roseus]SHF17023.1 Por secretion system C-terminal sorting domain-containing protein [Fodinibius roseus]